MDVSRKTPHVTTKPECYDLIHQHSNTLPSDPLGKGATNESLELPSTPARAMVQHRAATSRLLFICPIYLLR